MLDLRRATVFYLGYRLSKHKMIRYTQVLRDMALGLRSVTSLGHEEAKSFLRVAQSF